ncbi:cytochrome P450 2D26-like [Rhinoraja longicauda]
MLHLASVSELQRQPRAFSRLLHFKLRKQYGDVMSLDFGWTNVVVLSGYKAMKEALVKKSEDFADRPVLPIYEKIFKRFGEGIVLAKYGDWWKAQRKFALLTLKNFGLGKKSLELRIVEEAGFLNQAFEGEQDIVLSIMTNGSLDFCTYLKKALYWKVDFRAR